jgi:hypothetical protein
MKFGVDAVEMEGAIAAALSTGWTTEGSQFESQYVQEFSLFHVCPQRHWGPPSLLSNGYRVAFQGGKAAAA